MKLIHYYIILVVILLVLGAIILVTTYGSHSTLFFVSEAIIAGSIIFLVVFYRRTVRPMQAVTDGIDMLRQQDMSTFLAPTGQPDTDMVVDTFNTLLRNLRNEHLHTAEQNTFLNLLIQASTTGVILCPLDKEPRQVNPAARQMLTPELQSRLDAMPLGTDETVRLSNSQIYRVSHLSFTDGGRQHPFFLIQPLTDEVMEAERAAYERVIRMIAHEVNGTVGCISSTLDTIQPDISNPQSLNAVGSAAERLQSMAQFVTRFADVVRIPEPHLILCDLNEELENYRHIIAHMCQSAGIKLDMPATDSATPVRLDPTLFQQVIINIVKNSIESIKEKKSGGDTIRTVKASPLGGDGRGVPAKVTLSTHGRTLTITDNGAGIDADAMAHIFTPFYTTKTDGQGIGLLITRHILRHMGCRFSLATDPADHLTRFTIVFPNPSKGNVAAH